MVIFETRCTVVRLGLYIIEENVEVQVAGRQCLHAARYLDCRGSATLPAEREFAASLACGARGTDCRAGIESRGDSDSRFVPLPLCEAKSSEESRDIVVELFRGATTVTLRWSVSAWRVRTVASRVAQMIRMEVMLLATSPLDMHAGTDMILARVVKLFGAARPHHAYLFANKSSTHMKILIYDGLGIWLAARRLHKGRFVLNTEQLDALVKGLAWQTLAFDYAIRVV